MQLSCPCIILETQLTGKTDDISKLSDNNIDIKCCSDYDILTVLSIAGQIWFQALPLNHTATPPVTSGNTPTPDPV